MTRCKFWVGYSLVHGSAKCVRVEEHGQEYTWGHVFRVQVDHGAFGRFFRRCAEFLPGPLSQLIQAIFPGPFLPETVMVKTRKENWDDEFANEIQVYKKLLPLQGVVVPVFYGMTMLKGEPAFVMSDVGGRHLGAIDELDDEIRHNVIAAMRAIVSLGISPSDPGLANFLVSEDKKVFVVDLEQTTGLEPTKSLEENVDFVLNDVWYWHDHYKKARERSRQPLLKRTPLPAQPPVPRLLPKPSTSAQDGEKSLKSWMNVGTYRDPTDPMPWQQPNAPTASWLGGRAGNDGIRGGSVG